MLVRCRSRGREIRTRLRARYGTVLSLLNRSANERNLLGAPCHITGTVRALAQKCTRSPGRVLLSTGFGRSCHRVIVIGSVSFFSLYRRRVLPFCKGIRITCVPGKCVAKLDGVTHIISYCSRHLRIRRHVALRVGRYVRRTLGPLNIVIIIRTHRVYVRVQNIRGRGSIAAADSFAKTFGRTGAHRRFLSLVRHGSCWAILEVGDERRSEGREA